jgi:hypothetical protein
MPEDSLEKLGWLGFLLEKPPAILYHYTSMDGLLGIVNSGRIRATDIRYLNDESESKQIWNALRGRLQQRLAGTSGPELANAREILDAIENRHASGVFIDVFVASFSELGDSLSQWRAYSSGGIGFSIGFDPSALRIQSVTNALSGKPVSVMGRLARVRYVRADDDPSIDSVIAAIDQHASFMDDNLIKNLPGPEKPSRGDLFRAVASTMAPVFKNEAFSEEHEWRLILSKSPRPMPLKQFRAGKSMLIPYVEAEPTGEGSYFINEVVVGPTPHPALSKKAVESLFKSIGQPQVVVRESMAPYRHW